MSGNSCILTKRSLNGFDLNSENEGSQPEIQKPSIYEQKAFSK